MTIFGGIWKASTWLLDSLDDPWVKTASVIGITLLIIILSSVIIVWAIDKIAGTRSFANLSLTNPIRAAFYGIAGSRIDVTAAIQKQLKENGTVLIDNQLAGRDPAPNQHKSLHIEFQRGQPVNIMEGALIVLFDNSLTDPDDAKD